MSISGAKRGAIASKMNACRFCNVSIERRGRTRRRASPMEKDILMVARRMPRDGVVKFSGGALRGNQKRPAVGDLGQLGSDYDPPTSGARPCCRDGPVISLNNGTREPVRAGHCQRRSAPGQSEQRVVRTRKRTPGGKWRIGIKASASADGDPRQSRRSARQCRRHCET